LRRIVSSIKKGINAFKGRRFQEQDILGDGQFISIRNSMEAQGIMLKNTEETSIFQK